MLSVRTRLRLVTWPDRLSVRTRLIVSDWVRQAEHRRMLRGMTGGCLNERMLNTYRSKYSSMCTLLVTHHCFPSQLMMPSAAYLERMSGLFEISDCLRLCCRFDCLKHDKTKASQKPNNDRSLTMTPNKTTELVHQKQREFTQEWTRVCQGQGCVRVALGLRQGLGFGLCTAVWAHE